MVYESSPRWISSMKGDGKLPWACYYYTAFPLWLYGPWPRVLVCPIDCYGRSAFPPNTWKGVDKVFKKPMSFYGIGLITSFKEKDPPVSGMFLDVRTPEMIIDGCCPPQLMIAILAGIEV